MALNDGDVLDSAAAGPAAVRGGAIRIVGFIGGALLSLGSAALLFRHLGVRESGQYVTVQSVVVIAAGISDGGLFVMGVREHATLSGKERETMMRDLLGLRVVLTVIGMGGAVLFSALAGYSSTLVLGTLITGLAMLLTALQHQLGIGLTAELRQGWVSAADVLRQAVTALVIVLLVVGDSRLLGFFWANVIGCAAAVAMIVAITRRTIPLRPSWNPGRFRALMADTFSYSLAVAAGAVYVRLAIVLVSLIASDTQTGYYAASFRGVEVLLTIPTLLVGAAFPVLARAARDDRERLSYALGRILEVSLVLGAGVALTLGAGAPFIIKVVAGNDFAPAAGVLRIQGIGLFFSFIVAGWTFTALSMRRHSGVLWAILAALVVCAVLVPILASAHGATGAAVATTISEAVLTAGMALTVSRGGVASAVRPELVLRCLLALGLGVVAAVIPGLTDLERLAVSGVVYLAGLIVFRALPEEARDHLPGWAR